jgi:signal transduction histidine kinase/CheY-like chemotaxis protein
MPDATSKKILIKESRCEQFCRVKDRTKLAVVRFLVFLSLLLAAITCAAVSYLVLRNTERNNYENNYVVVTKQMAKSVEGFLGKYHATTHQLAVIANIKFPNASSWPFVAISDFHLLDESIINVTGSASGNSIVPIVKIDQLDEFNVYAREFLSGEDFINQYSQAYDLYHLGVWEFDDNGVPTSITDGTSGSTKFRNLITPIINPPKAVSKLRVALVNLHALEAAAIAMDDVLSCVEEGHEQCSSMSGYLIGTNYASVAESNIYTAIFGKLEHNGVREVVGFSTVGFNWQNELQRLIVGVTNNYDGLYCVLSSLEQPSGTASTLYTFILEDGEAKYVGEGSLHESNYDNMVVRIPLYLIGSYAQKSIHFRLDIYPSKAYEELYYTNTPLYTAIGFASMILFTSLIFFLYDYLMNENVKEKDLVLRIKRDFVRFISHEIRTPLNTVSVGLQLIFENLVAQQGGEALADDMLELTTDVQSSTAIAVSVLNDLLNFDKLEAGELEIAHEPVYIWDAIYMVVKSFKIPANQKKICIDLSFQNSVNGEDLNPKQLLLMGDKFKLCHIIRNMLSNALKFTDEGGSINVSVVWAKSPSSWKASSKPTMTGNSKIIPDMLEAKELVTISVTDTGHGLTPVQIGMLFRDGVQFNPNELQAGQGSGLGLYLSQALAALHGGLMWATSAGKGCGATFTVQLPISMIPLSDKAIEEASVVSRSASGPPLRRLSSSIHDNSVDSTLNALPGCNSVVYYTTRISKTSVETSVMQPVSAAAPATPVESTKPELGRILVVDDASSNRKIVCKILTKMGYECFQAQDGKECVDLVQNKGNLEFFDCILMDFEMPVLNGPDATDQLRKCGYTLPIYGLTGNVMPNDVEYFLKSGVDHVLPKPFQITDFNALRMEANRKINDFSYGDPVEEV